MTGRRICDNCELPIRSDKHVCADSLKRRLRNLVAAVGVVAACRKCGRAILWVTHIDKSKVPYDQSGARHFDTCPDQAPPVQQRLT